MAILWRPVIVVNVSIPCVTIRRRGGHVRNIDILILILCSRLCDRGLLQFLSGIA